MPGNIVLDEREAVNSGQRSAISNVSSYQSPQAAFLAQPAGLLTVFRLSRSVKEFS